MTGDPHQRPDDAMRETARALFLALADRPTARRQARALSWRRADPAHEAAWQRVADAWQSGGQVSDLAQARGPALSAHLDRIGRMHGRRRRRRRQALAGAVAACLAVAALWVERPHLLQDMAADHVAARARPLSVTLDDGSTVLLDADSALAEADTPTQRRVRLLRGGAYFEVRPGSLPFVVETPEGEVRVLGTGFDVQLLQGAVAVTLVHGRVEVSGAAGSAVLEPGQTVRLTAGGVGPVEQASLESALAWRDGRFVFYDARLEDVLGQIERYRRGRIVVAIPGLAEERVSGSFALAEPDAALASLQASFGFRVLDLGHLTIIGP
ncbi:FecR family protein [Paracoccus aminovorans]|uniref:FecR family protein n=1 Tax=Paracoccus aminovorans TaxID=34004 RepID=UPI002B25F09C|nr:FecR domain-containing protein [Paracoccus aminovorans]